MPTDVDVSESSSLFADSHAASSDRTAQSLDDGIQDQPNVEDPANPLDVRHLAWELSCRDALGFHFF